MIKRDDNDRKDDDDDNCNISPFLTTAVANVAAKKSLLM